MVQTPVTSSRNDCVHFCRIDICQCLLSEDRARQTNTIVTQDCPLSTCSLFLLWKLGDIEVSLMTCNYKGSQEVLLT